MTIYEKLTTSIKDKTYNFCNTNFDIYPHDIVRIFDNKNKTLLYQCDIIDFLNIPKDFGELEPVKEEFRKLDYDAEKRCGVFAICFYIGDKDIKIEKPISAKINYI